MPPDRKMIISSTWLKAAVVTFLFGFSVLGYLAARILSDHPPVPAEVRTPAGEIVFTGDDVVAGQHLFQKFGLMQYGTIFGHGAYLGPDFTAEALHRQGEAMLGAYRMEGLSEAEAAERVRRELKTNTYDPATGVLTFTPARAAAFEELVNYYRGWFGPMDTQTGLHRPPIEDPADVRRLTSFFTWSAWTSAALRPGTNYSYTNNWPPEPLAGNVPTGGALLWSVLSLVALLGGTGIILFVFGRYEQLGWQRTQGGGTRRFRPPGEIRLTPAQRAVPWYFLVVAALFLLQGLLGGLNAHYHVETEGFFGVQIAEWLPYNLSRMWHLQLALFFVSAGFLAMGIFLAPMIAAREPKHQDKLALILFGAVVLVVLGSLAGEAASIKDVIGKDGPWFWIGSQGWEYLDLGRLWQILLVGGMLFWAVILVRGLRERLTLEHPGNMPWLFIYSALSIPVFYSVGLFFGKDANFTVMNFWRFWVVHLWVEDFLEVFTTIMVAYIFVKIGVVRKVVALTIIYLDIILYSVGGVIGTMHHLYFSGAPAIHMALGAFFSAMEVIPLLLLTYEAWRFIQLGAHPAPGGMMKGSPSGAFPHKWAVMFLIAVGFWNFLGAGVLGFLINLPIVSYYEIGTQWTATHGHGAMMGVYGMLTMGFFMFVARYFIPPDRGSERAMACAFWSLNIGLAWMLFVNLFPVGLMQMHTALEESYWQARQPEFFMRPAVQIFEWLRLPGDALFILGGILPVLYLAVRMFQNRHRPGTLPLEEPAEELTTSR